MLPTCLDQLGLTSFEKPLDPNNGKLNAKFCMFCGLRILQDNQFWLMQNSFNYSQHAHLPIDTGT